MKKLFHDAGGDSISFLRSVLEEGTTLVPGEPSTIAHKLTLYGPALVSQDCHFHYGKPSGQKMVLSSHMFRLKLIGYHAMVLVGHREDKGKRHFLLQNWWYKKQFVEVDEGNEGSRRNLPNICFCQDLDFEWNNKHFLGSCTVRCCVCKVLCIKNFAERLLLKLSCHNW